MLFWKNEPWKSWKEISVLTEQDLWLSGSESSCAIDPCSSLLFSAFLMMKALHHFVLSCGKKGRTCFSSVTKTTRRSPEACRVLSCYALRLCPLSGCFSHIQQNFASLRCLLFEQTHCKGFMGSRAAEGGKDSVTCG